MKNIIILVVMLLIVSCSVDWSDLYTFEIPTEFETPEIFMEWVRENIEYKADEYDYWQTPSETISRGTGDCDDTAILIACAIEKYHGGRVTIGAFDTSGTGNGIVWNHFNTIYDGYVYSLKYDHPVKISEYSGVLCTEYTMVDIYNMMQFKRWK